MTCDSRIVKFVCTCVFQEDKIINNVIFINIYIYIYMYILAEPLNRHGKIHTSGNFI